MPALLESAAPCPEHCLLQCRLSWIVYIRPLLTLGMLLLVGLGAQIHMPPWALPVWAAVAVAGAGLLYHICWLRTVRLYADAAGVWLYRGILPWRRGAMLIKWRDMEDEGFLPGFGSWLFNAYTIRIGNRFDRQHDLIMHHAHDGREVATRLNALHGRFCLAPDNPSEDAGH